MDLPTAVATSMLPVSGLESRLSSKDLQLESRQRCPLELLWTACGVRMLTTRRSTHSRCSTRRTRARGAPRGGHRRRSLFDPAISARCWPASAIHRRCCGCAACLDVLTQPAVAISGRARPRPMPLQVGGAGSPPSWPNAAWSWSAASPEAWTRRRTAGCLDAGGTTVAVLGSGLDRVYPPEHERAGREIVRDGAAGERARARRAPPLAGALSAAQPHHQRDLAGARWSSKPRRRAGRSSPPGCALEQGRDVMAVPGSVLTGRNRGSHAF